MSHSNSNNTKYKPIIRVNAKDGKLQSSVIRSRYALICKYRDTLSIADIVNGFSDNQIKQMIIEGSISNMKRAQTQSNYRIQHRDIDRSIKLISMLKEETSPFPLEYQWKDTCTILPPSALNEDTHQSPQMWDTNEDIYQHRHYYQLKSDEGTKYITNVEYDSNIFIFDKFHFVQYKYHQPNYECHVFNYKYISEQRECFQSMRYTQREYLTCVSV